MLREMFATVPQVPFPRRKGAAAVAWGLTHAVPWRGRSWRSARGKGKAYDLRLKVGEGTSFLSPSL